MRTFVAGGADAIGLDLKPSRFTTLVGSIGDNATLRKALAGVTAIIHAATLHKPHIATHRRKDFLEANVAGTLALLEACEAGGVETFVYTSTTSVFGQALRPGPGAPAAWIDEDVVPVARNIYGVTKLAAEGLVELFARSRLLCAVILRTSRFSPEPDDDRDIRERYPPGICNLSVRSDGLEIVLVGPFSQFGEGVGIIMFEQEDRKSPAA